MPRQKEFRNVKASITTVGRIQQDQVWFQAPINEVARFLIRGPTDIPAIQLKGSHQCRRFKGLAIHNKEEGSGHTFFY